MKLRDPLSGYRLASGLTVLHFAYFFGILMLPKEAECDSSTANFRVAILNLEICHIVIYCLNITSLII